MIRYADLALLALALPVFLLADWPLLGYAVAAAAWLLQRGILVVVEHRVAAALARGERQTAMKLTAVSSLGRVWFVVSAALLVGLIAGDEEGLAAALLLVALFSIQLVTAALARLGGSEGAS